MCSLLPYGTGVCHYAFIYKKKKKKYCVCPFHFYIVKLFSSLYIAASHAARVHYFSCLYTLLVVVYMYYFLEHVTLDFFFLIYKFLWKYCKAQ